MRENQKRGLNAASYNTPASVFNTLAVVFDSKNATANANAVEPVAPVATPQAPQPEKLNDNVALKTLPIPATELLKLNRIMDEKSDDGASIVSETNSTTSTETLERYKDPQDALATPQERPLPPEYPSPCEIINAHTQKTHSIDPKYQALQKNDGTGQYDMANAHIPPQTFHPPNITSPYYPQQPYPVHLPPQHPLQSPSSIEQKSRSLERNASQNIVQAYAARLNSLERTKQADYAPKVSRSNSLNRQLGTAASAAAAQSPNNVPPYGPQSGSLERKQPPAPPPYAPPSYATQKGGSLERNQSQTIVDMMSRGYRGGSLERNQAGAYIMVNRSSSLERNIPYQHAPYRAPKKEECFQEEIYDFGGINVKSCASIALKKSVERGLLPASVLQQQQPSPQEQHHSMPPNIMYTQNQRPWMHRMQQSGGGPASLPYAAANLALSPQQQV